MCLSGYPSTTLEIFSLSLYKHKYKYRTHSYSPTMVSSPAKPQQFLPTALPYDEYFGVNSSSGSYWADPTTNTTQQCGDHQVHEDLFIIPLSLVVTFMVVIFVVGLLGNSVVIYIVIRYILKFSSGFHLKTSFTREDCQNVH